MNEISRARRHPGCRRSGWSAGSAASAAFFSGGRRKVLFFAGLWLCLGLSLGLGVSSLVGCGGTPPVDDLAGLDIETVPNPELGAAEPAVREQLERARRAMEERLEGPGVTAAERAAAYGELAQLYHAYDLAEPAAAAYRNARRLAPGEVRWAYLLGVLSRLEGDLDQAAASLTAARRLNPDDPPTLLHLAAVELDRGHPEAATEAARAALAYEETAAAHAALGQAAEDGGDDAAAIEHYTRALELQPSASRLHYLLGQAHRRQGDLELAREHLEQQGQTDAGFADPRVASLYTSLAGSAAMMQRGASAKVAGFLEASLASYRRAVANAPRSPEARRDLGSLLAQLGRLDEAVDQYREALRLEPDVALNPFTLGLVLEAAGGEDEALGLIARAVELEPDYREFRRALASRLARRGQYDEARQHHDHLLERDPADVEVRLERAKVRAQLGDLAGAFDDASQVLDQELRPRLQAMALQVIGEVQARRGETAAARTTLTRALELDPDLGDAHFALANLLGVTGDYAAAAERYRRVTELQPERSTAWLGEATALSLLGRGAEAAERLAAAVAQRPDDGVVTYALARLLVASPDPEVRDGERGLALAERLFAAQKTPEHGELMALALAAVGRFDEAVAMQRRLLDAMPPGTSADLRRRWTENLARFERRGGNSG